MTADTQPPEPQTDPLPEPRGEVVWDIAIRLFHWTLIALVATSWWTAEEGRMEWHRWSGLAILGLLVFRIYWGFAGPETARFASFVKGPKAILGYAATLFSLDQDEKRGHNPLGALSIVALLATLVAQVSLGLFAVDVDGLESGPLAHLVSFDTGRLAAGLHETAFNVLMILILLHVAAIAFYLLYKGANLIQPMITGRRSSEATYPSPAPQMKPAPLWRYAAGVALAALVVWLIAR